MEKKEYAAPIAAIDELSDDIVLASAGWGPLNPFQPSNPSAPGKPTVEEDSEW